MSVRRVDGRPLNFEPDPLPFEVVLWHEGFWAGKSMSPTDLELYLDTLISFAKKKKIKTVFISVPF